MIPLENSRISEVLDTLKALSPESLENPEIRPPLEVAAFIMIGMKLDIVASLLAGGLSDPEISKIMYRINEGFILLDGRFRSKKNQAIYENCVEMFRKDIQDVRRARGIL